MSTKRERTLWSDGRLSARMEAIVSLVTGGRNVVDVGCDHAYLPVALVERGICPSAQACDVRPGPCRTAEKNIASAGAFHKTELPVEVICCNGIPEEAAGGTLLVTGMGGALIAEILKAGAGLLDRFFELILGPQSEPELLRYSLTDLSFRICDERMVEEDGKFYLLIRAVPDRREDAETPCDAQDGLTECEARFGPVLLHNRDETLLRSLQKKKNELEELLKKLAAENSGRAVLRVQELLQEREWIREAMSYYEGQGDHPAY